MKRHTASTAGAICLLALVAVATTAQATTIKILDGPTSSDSFLNNHYNDNGLTSSLFSGPITAAVLAGVDVLVTVAEDDTLTASEISAIDAFLAGDGRVIFMGENGGYIYNPGANNSLNTALSTIGSGIALANDGLDGGQEFATTANGRLLSHPLTAGVEEIIYAGVTSMIGVPAGHGLMETADLPGELFAGFDPLKGDGVVVIGDVSWLGFLNDSFYGYDNGLLALNLATLDVPSFQVPAPATGALVLFGLAAMRRARRRTERETERRRHRPR